MQCSHAVWSTTAAASAWRCIVITFRSIVAARNARTTHADESFHHIGICRVLIKHSCKSAIANYNWNPFWNRTRYWKWTNLRKRIVKCRLISCDIFATNVQATSPRPCAQTATDESHEMDQIQTNSEFPGPGTKIQKSTNRKIQKSRNPNVDPV